MSVCVCVSVCGHDNSENNGSIHLKPKHIVVYENSSDEFDIRKIARMNLTSGIAHLPRYKVSSPKLWHLIGSCD